MLPVPVPSSPMGPSPTACPICCGGCYCPLAACPCVTLPWLESLGVTGRGCWVLFQLRHQQSDGTQGTLIHLPSLHQDKGDKLLEGAKPMPASTVVTVRSPAPTRVPW